MSTSNFPKEITLEPSTPADKIKIYQWLSHSNLTPEMLGEPNFPDNPVPGWEEFDDDYASHYFDGTKPLEGRCFIILKNKEEVGQINYNAILKRQRQLKLIYGWQTKSIRARESDPGPLNCCAVFCLKTWDAGK